MSDPDINQFLRDFRTVTELAGQAAASGEGASVTEVLDEFLGAPVTGLAVTTEQVPAHRFVDWDLAAELVTARDPEHRSVGIRAPMHYPGGLREFSSAHFGRIGTGQVDYVQVATGVDTHRSAIACGLRLFHRDGHPVVIFQRRADRRHGGEDNVVEIVCPAAGVAEDVLTELRSLSVDHSVLRRQVITLGTTGYGPESEEVTFLPRPEVTADQVVLPADTLQRITDHVVGTAAHTNALRQHGQHLKRGLLLYGPPGTGKTHTVRHLVSQTPEHTVVLLSGGTLQFIRTATQMARLLQPAVVVLEDCDLVAEDRGFHGGPHPLLFEVLDAMDGLDGDADVTFLLTTNRVADLERALAQRPGRVDLAVEVPLPDRAGRIHLLELYGRQLNLAADVLTETADLTEGMTASFFKELARRTVLTAAVAGAVPGPSHLRAARDELLSDASRLTRALLVGDAAAGEDGGPDESSGTSSGWMPGPGLAPR